jgi:hypothetical protein
MKRKCGHCGADKKVLYSKELDESLCQKCAEKEINRLHQDANDYLYEAEVWEILLGRLY